MINEKRLKKWLKLKNKRGSVIIIIVKNKLKALNLYAKKLKFRGIPKVIEKYWKARPNSIYMTCFNIGHN